MRSGEGEASGRGAGLGEHEASARAPKRRPLGTFVRVTMITTPSNRQLHPAMTRPSSRRARSQGSCSTTLAAVQNTPVKNAPQDQRKAS